MSTYIQENKLYADLFLLRCVEEVDGDVEDLHDKGNGVDDDQNHRISLDHCVVYP